MKCTGQVRENVQQRIARDDASGKELKKFCHWITHPGGNTSEQQQTHMQY
jgi:hypothetical protein